ncbi:YihY/virulence factor BrkB family protein [Mesorhizobium sp. VK22B]|uniref:YihY/virulence factor BrkB family protein n=2 Tax=Mesorhizobium captivum TaxID=3072319 RepID=A0ABU4YZ44_9HYPH|nr:MULTISPECIES: YihY/virulence factor BrkB family protein [unclassified Mesorhizobium]MDX8492238.1 YihY/virulence factor BrkB family protein [Mesorhizobium sp. VK22B]MDX8506291.1 YihY/virulence factor BrkB family protein [Mesorhizobium sp. VK22E]
MQRWFQEAWVLLKESVAGYLNDNALSHGAAMAFYATTSLAPILLIVVAIAGIVIGNDAAQLALSAEFSGVMGPQSADLLKATIETAAHRRSSTLATIVGLIALLVTASGVFGEMQQSLNEIWKVKPNGLSLSRLVRARAASLGLVAALGFMLLVSLAASTAISALSELINERLPFGELIVSAVNTIVSFVLIALLFAAIYKVLPDRRLKWRDVAIGSVVTALLFTIGKSLIGWYIGTSAIATSYGAAGALIVVLLWVYYSAQIFLFGAEVTRAYSVRSGSRPDLAPVVAAAANNTERSAGSSKPGVSDGEVAIWIVFSSLITLLVSQVWRRRG